MEFHHPPPPSPYTYQRLWRLPLLVRQKQQQPKKNLNFDAYETIPYKVSIDKI